MNILKKIYCRIFQKCFHVAIPLLPYREPELIRGFAGVPGVLAEKKISRVMLVTDPGVYGLGLTEPLEDLLKAAGIFVSVYKDTVANPTSANVEEARRQYLQDQCQGLIAFGGGSSMDCAKGIGARLARPGKSLARMEGILKVMRRLPLLIAIPTTAGTGSETTLAAVITDADMADGTVAAQQLNGRRHYVFLCQTRIQALESALKLMTENNFAKILAHAPYTMNLCSAKPETREFAPFAPLPLDH